MIKLILIGGVPGTGKTTLAYNLALLLNIDKVISIDVLKILYKSLDLNVDKYFNTCTHEAYKIDNINIIDGYLKHCNCINNIVLKVINNIKDNFIIIEGSTLNRIFINNIDKTKYEIYYYNLVLDKDSLIKRYNKKLLLRKSNWIDNIEIINEIGKYNSFNNVNIINDKLDFTIERIINDVENNLCYK